MQNITQINNILYFILLLGMVNCRGPQGDTGPQGAVGTKGIPGDAGNPNVVYTDWKTYTWQVKKNTNDSYELSVSSTDNPVFTRNAISSAAIFTYVKYQTFADSIPTTYKLVERISNSKDISHYFKIPGRKNASFFDYGFSYIATGGIDENYFSPTIQVNTYTLGQAIPELQNQSADYIRNLVKNLPQFRHVIVYGGVKNGRLASINWSNYDEVKQILSLKN